MPQTSEELQERLTQIEQTYKTIFNTLNDQMVELHTRLKVVESSIAFLTKTMREISDTQILTLEVVHDLDNRKVSV
jgi:uncharacterized coiled-coil protein SlyX